MNDYEIIELKNYDILLKNISFNDNMFFDKNNFNVINNIEKIDNKPSINILKEMKKENSFEHNLFISTHKFIS